MKGWGLSKGLAGDPVLVCERGRRGTVSMTEKGKSRIPQVFSCLCEIALRVCQPT